jgi:proteic killer suppression protein
MKFKDKDIEAFWNHPSVIPYRVPPAVRKALYRKLQMLDAAVCIADLRIPPSNHLEKLSGKREGQFSIRVNQQYRLCFVWTSEGAERVEFCDYHK